MSAAVAEQDRRSSGADVPDDPVLERIVSDLRGAYGDRLAGILLYGSRARGDHRPDSDYDVAVVFATDEDYRAEKDRLWKLGWRIFLETGASVHLWPLKPRGLDERTIHLHNVRKDAVPLFASSGLPSDIAGRRPLPARASSMKPDTARELTRAERALAAAQRIAEAGEILVAGREAYTAALHAARAVIFEARETSPKTHQGTHRTFHEISRNMRTLNPDLAGLLGNGFELKIIVDDGDREEIGEETARITLEEAERFIDMARRMIAEIEATRNEAGEAT